MSQTQEFSEVDDQNTFKILVATDIHLGYAERDPVRCDDSFTTFEEVLKIAVKEEVDFILLGGDLFHETKPSPYCIYKCIDLLRKYCLGEKPVEIEFLSNQEKNFSHSSQKVVNYEDPNMNVAIPVFSIHGNHDDPTGEKQISAMDLLASTGLVNYFGRWTDLNKVEISPILLRKGETQLALYGLSHIKDERLGRLFLDNKVTVLTPPSTDREWFNLFVLHQNRAVRGPKNSIPESCIPECMTLVIWGHEHDCRILPERAMGSDCFISQPGSTIATSLILGESIPKSVGLLLVKGESFKLNPIELKTVRPFIYKEIELPSSASLSENSDNLKHSDRSMKIIKDEIEIMIQEASGLERAFPMIPLIRLIARFKDERQVFNAIRFGHLYVGKVANPSDLLKFQPVRNVTAEKKKKFVGTSDADLGNPLDWAQKVEDIVLKYFDGKNKMSILSVKGMNEAVSKYIITNDNEAPAYLVKCQAEKTLKKLMEIKPDVKEVKQCIEELRNQRELNDRDEEEARSILNDANRAKTTSKKTVNVEDDITISDDSDDEAGDAVERSKQVTSVRGRGSRGNRRARESRGPRASRGSRASRA